MYKTLYVFTFRVVNIIRYKMFFLSKKDIRWFKKYANSIIFESKDPVI